jgi:type VI secretion system secreted protein Hcp
MAKGDMFLKLDGIEGESNDDKKKSQIEIDSFSLGGTNSNLFGVLTAGKHIATATVTVRKAGGDPKDYLTITLSPCLVSSYNMSAHGGGGLPQESFSLNFDKMEVEYKTQDDKGTLGGPIKKYYETSKNKAG